MNREFIIWNGVQYRGSRFRLGAGRRVHRIRRNGPWTCVREGGEELEGVKEAGTEIVGGGAGTERLIEESRSSKPGQRGGEDGEVELLEVGA